MDCNQRLNELLIDFSYSKNYCNNTATNVLNYKMYCLRISRPKKQTKEFQLIVCTQKIHWATHSYTCQVFYIHRFYN